MLEPAPGLGHNAAMTAQEPEHPTEADLEQVDAAEAPPLAERLADELEADLEGITDLPGGEG